MRGCRVLGAHEADLAYLMNHLEERHMKQKGLEDGGEQKGQARAGSTQARPKRMAEGAHRNPSGQAGPMAGGNHLGGGYTWVPLSTRTLWLGLDCHGAELEGGRAGWG